MKIALSTLIVAAAWAVAATHSPGIHSTPGYWITLIGLPGVALALSLVSISDYFRSDSLAYFIMFLGNWVFLWGAVKGFLSLKRRFFKQSYHTEEHVKVVLRALVLAIAWTAALILIARTVGLHSTPGMWAGAVGLPGVVIANWIQARLFHEFHRSLGYSLMFLINWGFYCSVLQGINALKRRLK